MTHGHGQSVGTDCGSGAGVGRGRQRGKFGTTVIEQQKKLFVKKMSIISMGSHLTFHLEFLKNLVNLC